MDLPPPHPHFSRQDKPSDRPAKSDAAGPQAAPNRRVAGTHNDGHLRAQRDARIGDPHGAAGVGDGYHGRPPSRWPTADVPHSHANNRMIMRASDARYSARAGCVAAAGTDTSCQDCSARAASRSSEARSLSAVVAWARGRRFLSVSWVQS
jgi:hypothetical protein